MDRDLDSISEDLSSDQNQYKVYKRRWLVLFAMTSVALVVGLHRSLIPIAELLEEYLHKTTIDYERMTQVSMYTTLFSVLIIARMLDHYGLRRMAYVACVIIIFANCLKALCLWDDVSPWWQQQRYKILLLSEAFVGIAMSITFCVPAKVAGVWFAKTENTLALVIVNCGYNIGFSCGNYFTPIFIGSAADMYKLSYMFLLSALFLTVIVLTCVTRSSPKIPPSSCAVVSANTKVPLILGVRVMMSDWNYVILHLTLALNLAVLNVEQLELDDILRAQDYSDTFCGKLIAHNYFFGIFFMLIAAFWIDNSSNYIRVSRYSALLLALSTIAFNYSLLFPNIRSIILATNLFSSFGSSLMYPALMQVAIRNANGILAEATVSSLALSLQQILMSSLSNLISPLKSLSPAQSQYTVPLITFLSITSVINLVYVAFFRVPNRTQLQSKLIGHEQLVAESM